MDSSTIPIKTFIGNTDTVRDLMISLDNKLIVSASLDKKIKIWSIKRENALKTLFGHNITV